MFVDTSGAGNMVINSGIEATDIDVINRHLTATIKDFTEIENWSKALNLTGDAFPYINFLKSMIGYCLSAEIAIENVVSVLQIPNFIFSNINCEDLNEQITSRISEHIISQTLIKKKLTL